MANNYENLIDLSLLSIFKAQNDLAYAAKSTVDTLVGSDAGKSARTIAAEELAVQLVPANAQEALNTLAEIAAWIQAHPGDAAAMNAAITALQNKVDTGDQTVSAYVAAAIAALNIGDYATAANLTALAARVTDLENTVEGLGVLADKDEVTEADLAAELKAKVNAAAEGNHSHDNKTVLDGVTAEKVAAWDAKSDFSGAYADLTGKPAIPSTVAELTDAADYAKKTDIPTITLATEADILALFA